jgi:transketolase
MEEDLKQIANEVRARIIETSCVAKMPHLGSCLSCTDILVALYWKILNIDSHHPKDPTRDRFILSKGHAAPALFQILAMRKFFPESWLNNYGHDGSLFGEHPPAHGVPGVEAATGSLGHGLPIGAGLALGAKIQKLPNRIYVLLSDGECNEGSVWEAALFAAAQKLDQLTAIIDFNKWQATGRSEEVMALNPLIDKWRSFGWNTVETDGHDFAALIPLLKQQPKTNRPFMIIAHTVKGKGVSFMEDDNNWHYRTPTKDEVILSKKELMVMA